ncbi:Alpha/Beta hydrolase protein [Cladochytrium replicatum]|nr:Alpha/Beta hydrolase protein [Cladochytrium replicatum]
MHQLNSTSFQIPRNDGKDIKATLTTPISDSVAQTSPEASDSSTVIRYGVMFLHGSGGDMDSGDVKPLCEYLTTHHGLPVLRFTMGGNLEARIRQAHTVQTWMRSRYAHFIMVGRSMGARVVAKILCEPDGDRKGVCLAFPVLGRPDSARIASDLDERKGLVSSLPNDVRVLFIRGTRDTYTDGEVFRDARSLCAAKNWEAVVEGADHGLKIWKKGWNGVEDGEDVWIKIVSGLIVGWLEEVVQFPAVCKEGWVVKGWEQGDCNVNIAEGTIKLTWKEQEPTWASFHQSSGNFGRAESSQESGSSNNTATSPEAPERQKAD